LDAVNAFLNSKLNEPITSTIPWDIGEKAMCFSCVKHYMAYASHLCYGLHHCIRPISREPDPYPAMMVARARHLGRL